MAVTRNYFQKFPSISYNDYVVRDVSIRAKLSQYIAEAGLGLLPYSIKDGERADNIASFYYDDPYYAWAIYLCNSIVDPYEGWPKDTNTLNDYISKVYGSFEESLDVIKRYEVNWAEDTSIISPTQFNELPIENRKYWEPDFGFNKEIISYHRKEVDWVLDNNRLDLLEVVASNSELETLTFTLDERMYQYNSTGEAVKSTLVSVANTTSKTAVSLNAAASDILFSTGDNILTVQGTLNLITKATITGTNIPANTYIKQIVNTSAIEISSNTTGSSTGSYTVSNPARAFLVMKQVDFYPVVFTSNSTLATPDSFFAYSVDAGDYEDTGNYIIGKKSSANVVVLTHERIDTRLEPNALLSNSHISTNELQYWKSVSAYEDEVNKNEEKKNIYVLDKNIIGQLNDALEKIVKNG